MKTKTIIISCIIALFTISVFGQTPEKLISNKTHVKFYSHTSVEDIEANNYVSVNTINTKTGDVVFSIPMQSFEFEKAMMQKHFNSAKFLDTKNHPKAKLKGKITNLSDVDFTKDGSYDVTIKGEMTIKGVTKSITEKGKVIVTNGKIKIESTFNIVLNDYEIAFDKGKPSTNIAKTIEVTVKSEY